MSEDRSVCLQDCVTLESYVEEMVYRVNTDALRVGAPTTIVITHEVEVGHPVPDDIDPHWFIYEVNDVAVGEGNTLLAAKQDAVATLFECGYSRLAAIVECLNPQIGATTGEG